MMSPSHMIDFVKVLYRERQTPERLASLASVWWWSMLVIAIALFITTAGAGAYELNKTLEPLTTSSQTPSRVPSPALDRVALDALNAAFEQRQGLYTAAQTHLPVFINPSD